MDSDDEDSEEEWEEDEESCPEELDRSTLYSCASSSCSDC